MITPLPIPPSRQDPANFSQRADDFMGALPTFATEANSTATSVNNDASAASASAVNAAVSATAANASANVSKWVSGTTYAQGDVEWSPINFFSYRRKIAGAGTTDPSADPTNWALVSGAGDVSLTGVQTLTNKTLTSPVINTPVINTPTINSINGGQLAGMRNLLINGNLAINQRVYVSGTAVGASNTYTLDRWRVVTSGQNLAFTASGNGNSMTAPAGGVEQVIEGANIGGGTYVLGWTGTATATVNGMARTKGESFTLAANTNATVRLISGTASLVQLEPGSTPTPFEHRPYGAELAICQRYYETGNYVEFYYWTNAWGANKSDHVTFKATKRAAPTIGGTFSGGGWTGTWSTANVTANGFTFSNNATVNTGVFDSIADWTANSEL